ncbi:LamG-like jellyroll fold domain-containing protein [Streptomyces atratus]|uniref:LamG domain-containing protein n=1 Tax=Streptomyces atratus TaxID=1893 RepID=UPI00367CD528
MNNKTFRHARIRAAVVVGALTSLLITGLGELPQTQSDAQAASAQTATKGKAPNELATEEQAARAATEFDQPVEVASLRNERSQTFANPDGTFTAKEYAQPVRVRKDGKWTDIDTTLIAQPDGRLVPKATSAAMSLSPGGDGPFASLVRDGKTLSVSWPSKLPKPTVDGATATYKSVLPDVDLVVRAESDGFSHLLVVKSAKAAANPALAAIDLPLKASGGLNVATDDGGLVAEDKASGGTVFESPEPVMWDSSGNTSRTAPVQDAGPGPSEGARIADVGLEVRKNTMVLKPDAELLKGKNTKYPVFIDPVTKTATRTSWTWVSSGNPGLEGWKFSNSDDGVESGKGVGRCPADVSVRCVNANDVQRQYYAMPTGSYEGKTILKAEFAITLVHTYNSGAHAVELHRVNSSGGSAISSSTNWGNKPSSKDHITSESPTNPAGSCSITNQNVRFAVTGTIQNAANSGWDTTTFGLEAGAEGSYESWKRFCNNAALEIQYNRPPFQPKMSDLSMSPGGKCVYGEATKHYANTAPVLKAVVWDPDHGDIGANTEQLKAQFEVFWTGKDGVQKTYTVTTASKTSNSDKNGYSGYETFKYTVGTDLPGDGTGAFTVPQNTVIGWVVRGSDGTAWGPWSDDGSANRCEFIVDSTKPAPPTVTSAEYPEDDTWHTGVGDYGSFSLYSPGTDVAKYTYQFTGEAEKTIVPDEPGRAAVVRWMPKSEGPRKLYVEAWDTAGNSKEIVASYDFLVTKGRSPKASWALADAAGSTQAAAGNGAAAATAGSGVTFGVKGPHGSVRTAASLDGTANAYLNTGTHIVDTDKTFSVAGWVMLPELPKTSMSLISQDGSAQSGFSLGYDAKTQRWSFLAPDSEIDSMMMWEVLGPKPVPGEWTHLIGVYDMDEQLAGATTRGSMRMYVSGREVTGDIQQRSTTWNATGSLQIGRALEPAGYTANLKGSVADVQVFDRVVAAEESERLGGLPPLRLGYWEMDEAEGGIIPGNGGGMGLTLAGNASIYQPDESCDPVENPDCPPIAEPLWGAGHLALDGTSGYAHRASGLLKSKASFTITARARLSSPDATANQAVLSLPGTAGTTAVIRFDAAADRWQLALTEKDATDAAVTKMVAGGVLPSSSGDGDHLALSYNALFGEVLLYVNGIPAGQPIAWPNSWDLAKSGLQLGRTGVGSAAGEYLSGAIDEVRVFEGALDAPMVAMVAGLEGGSNLGGAAT